MKASLVALNDVLLALDAQCEDYRSMYREGLAQRDNLQADEVRGLTASAGRVRALMDRVRERQASLPADLVQLGLQHPQVAERIELLRSCIQSVLDLRAQSEQVTRELLDQTRRQMRQIGTGKRASRGYQRPPSLREPRFVDVH
jgi:hypothetical protein